MENHFKKSITKLETLIHKLEVNVGVQHTKSPFDIQQSKKVEIDKVCKQEHKVEQNIHTENQVMNLLLLLTNLKKIVNDFSHFELRVGEITDCKILENSTKLYTETILLGNLGTRSIATGCRQFIPIIADMHGLCLVFVNLKEKSLAGFPSHGMVLCVSNSDHSQVDIVRPEFGTKVGERVQLENCEQLKDETKKEVTPKDKAVWKIFEQFRTDENSFATFQGLKLKTSAGFIKCKNFQNCQIS